MSDITQLTTEVVLNDGNVMPRLGLGVFRMSDAEAEQAVLDAHDVGYRLIDTAAGYRNEAGVGRAIARVGAREDFFITTKLPNDQQGHDSALRQFDASMGALGIDVLDLYLIHWPAPARGLYVETWKALVRLQAEGRVRSIGVSNFLPEHIERIADATGVLPAIDQVELHPFLPQTQLRGFLAARGIAAEAWSPLGAGNGLLEHPTVVRTAAAAGVTPAQLILLWHLSVDDVVIPKSTNPVRMRENLSVLNLVGLAETALADLATLDTGTRFGPDPLTFG